MTENRDKKNGTDEFIIVSKNQDPGAKDITIENLSVRLPNAKGTVLVDNLNATIKPGDRIMLTGESGAGKTTTVKGLVGKWDTGSGHISVPANYKIRTIPQHVGLPDTNLRGILNLTPSDQYIFTDRELKDALVRAGLPQLVQHIPGQQAEILFNELIDLARKELANLPAEKAKGDDLYTAATRFLTNKAKTLADEQFDYAQYVPDEQRASFAENLKTLFSDLIEGEAPDHDRIEKIAGDICTEIDTTLAKIVMDNMDKAIKESVRHNLRGKFFWPRLPLSPLKADYFSNRLKRTLAPRLNAYLTNTDTEDPAREIRLNKNQIDILTKEITKNVHTELKEKYVRKGTLSTIFNAVTWPLHLLTLPLRAMRVAHEMTQSLSFVMDRQVVKGDTFERQLSGGQLKRLMAARAMLHKPDLLIMDEITTGVDDASKRAIYKDVLDALPKDTAIISILHDLELVDLHTRHAHLANKALTFEDVDPDEPTATLEKFGLKGPAAP